MSEGQEPAKQDAPAATPAPDAKEGQEPKGDKPETFDRSYVEQLRGEAASNRKKVAELAEKLQEIEDKEKSEVERLSGKVTKAEQAKADAEAKLLRFEIAAEKQVPAKLVPLLTATDREGLEGQADLILENAQAKEKSPEFDGGTREPAPEPKTAEQKHNDTVLSMLGLSQPNT